MSATATTESPAPPAEEAEEPPVESEGTEEASVDTIVKPPKYAPWVGGGAFLVLVITVLFTSKNPHPPIGQMGWSIIAWIALGLVARYCYRETAALLKRAELNPDVEDDILHNLRLLMLILGASVVGLGIFIGSVY